MKININEQLKDFLTFKCLITPVLIQVFFWVMLALTLVSAVVYAIRQDFLTALLTLIVGPLLLRAACEIMIILFNINASLIEFKAKQNLENK